MKQPSQVRAATKKHVILFLAANPHDTARLALDREARSIHVELKRSGYRDRFDFVTRWAAEPLDLLRELCRDATAHIWDVSPDEGTLDEWIAVAERSPFVLDGIALVRRPPPGSGSKPGE